MYLVQFCGGDFAVKCQYFYCNSEDLIHRQIQMVFFRVLCNQKIKMSLFKLKELGYGVFPDEKAGLGRSGHLFIYVWFNSPKSYKLLLVVDFSGLK